MAAIDVGTNSIHMIVVETQRHGYRVIDKEKEMVLLGRDSLEGRPLTDDAIERGVTALRKMAGIADRWKVRDVVAVATSAIREAPNRRKFLSAAEKAAGVKVRMISGEEEADYIYRAVRSAVDFHGGTAMSVDIGGGSVEIIVGTNDEVFFTRSEPVGALRMAQRFGLDRAADANAADKCRAHVRKTLKKTLAQASALGFDFTVGTSGTIVTLSELSAETNTSGGGNGVASGLRWLSRARLGELIETLLPLSVEARSSRYGIDARRAETIVAGALVLEQIMDGVKVEQLRACSAALREGIVEYQLDRMREEKEKAPRGSVRRSSVMALSHRTAIERAHASHVAKLALRIFDQTQDLHMLRTGERELLEYAAMLHEAGMHVSYQGYHRHSYYLISHAGLHGFTSDQVAIVANVARYHRKGPPAEEDLNFTQLSRAQQQVVQKLSAILRIADALDRGRRGTIRDVGVEVSEKKVVFKPRPRGDAEVELEAADKYAKYFARVFERRVAIEVKG
jgi:exopolyphosphatase/guanosine-5'-triphosphate,3'-diphosphate pyrophosphatase